MLRAKVHLPARERSVTELSPAVRRADDIDRAVLGLLTTHKSAEATAAALSQCHEFSQEERCLWRLWDMSLNDDQAAASQNADIFEIAPPSERRWFTSDYACLQHITMRSPLLRRLVLVLRWLEDSATCPGQGELTRASMFQCLRAGHVDVAEGIAASAKDFEMAAILRGVQLYHSNEPWNAMTSPVLFFSEYARQSIDNHRCVQPHRLSLLATIHGDLRDDASLDVITRSLFGAFVGDESQSIRAFGTAPHWRDQLWCQIRGHLVKVFTYALCRKNERPEAHDFVSWIENRLDMGTGGDWVEKCTNAFQVHTAHFIRTLMQTTADCCTWYQLWSILSILDPEKAHQQLQRAPAAANHVAVVVALLMHRADSRSLPGTVPYTAQRDKWYCEALQTYCIHVVTESTPSEVRVKLEMAAELLSTISDVPVKVRSYAAVAEATRKKARESLVEDVAEQAFMNVIRVRDGDEIVEKLLRYLSTVAGHDADPLGSVCWLTHLDANSNRDAVLRDAAGIAEKMWRSGDIGNIANIAEHLNAKGFVIEAHNSPFEFWLHLARLRNSAVALGKSCMTLKNGNLREVQGLELRSAVRSQFSSMISSALSAAHSCPSSAVDALGTVISIVSNSGSVAFLAWQNESETFESWRQICGVVDRISSLESVATGMSIAAAAEAMRDFRGARALLSARFHDLIY